jgi:predicted nuclease of predicted toxin-antitoxin system
MSSEFKLLLDENIPQIIAAWILSVWNDWEVLHVNDVGLKAKSDAVIFMYNNKQGAH